MQPPMLTVPSVSADAHCERNKAQHAAARCNTLQHAAFVFHTSDDAAAHSGVEPVMLFAGYSHCIQCDAVTAEPVMLFAGYSHCIQCDAVTAYARGQCRAQQCAAAAPTDAAKLRCAHFVLALVYSRAVTGQQRRFASTAQ